jgi:hypothetical protein
MTPALTGVRDGLVVIGLALLLCLLGVSSFAVADRYHVNSSWVFFAWGSFAMIPLLLRAFRGHPRRPLFLPFLGGASDSSWAHPYKFDEVEGVICVLVFGLYC